MATLTDYLGRKADLLAFQLMFPFFQGREQLLAQELVRPGQSGALIAGIQKLVQRVLLALLLEQGSKQYRPQDGTRFMIDARLGFWRTSADVSQSFYAARLDVARQIVLDEADTDPPDERYRGMDLTGVVLNGDRVTLRLAVSSQAGRSFTFLTPLTVPLK